MVGRATIQGVTLAPEEHRYLIVVQLGRERATRYADDLAHAWEITEELRRRYGAEHVDLIDFAMGAVLGRPPIPT